MIDREKIRRIIRQRRDGEDLLRLLDRAVDRLPDAELLGFIRGYAWPRDLEVDRAVPPALGVAIEQFREASFRGEYYETLDVKSRYHWMKSRGTQLWIAEFHRLLELCAVAAGRGEIVDARAGYEQLFVLLARVDAASPNIISLLDEHGSEPVGVDWATVLPTWFGCLAGTAPAGVFAANVHAVVAYFAHYEWDGLLPRAVEVADEEQRVALMGLPRPKRSYGELVLQP